MGMLAISSPLTMQRSNISRRLTRVLSMGRNSIHENTIEKEAAREPRRRAPAAARRTSPARSSESRRQRAHVNKRWSSCQRRPPRRRIQPAVDVTASGPSDEPGNRQ